MQEISEDEKKAIDKAKACVSFQVLGLFVIIPLLVLSSLAHFSSHPEFTSEGVDQLVKDWEVVPYVDLTVMLSSNPECPTGYDELFSR